MCVCVLQQKRSSGYFRFAMATGTKRVRKDEGSDLSPAKKYHQADSLQHESETEEQTSTVALPHDLQLVVQDMACRRQDNGSPSSFGFIIVIEVDFTEKIHGVLERRLEEWVWDSLDRAHRALDFETPWMFVSNVRDDQFNGDMSDDEDGKIIEDRRNSYQVCVYTEPNGKCVLPLFNYSRFEGMLPVDPSAILGYFDTEPAAVRSISVSGVDQPTLKSQWVACIIKDPTEFSRPGRGYMRHPMWRLPSKQERSYLSEQDQLNCFPRLMTVREKSFDFGWPAYPGELGNDW